MHKFIGDSKPVEKHIFSNVAKLKFLSMCLRVVDTYDDPLTFRPIAIFTLLRKDFNKIIAGLVYDTDSTFEQSLGAVSVRAIRCGLSTGKLYSASYAPRS